MNQTNKESSNSAMDYFSQNYSPCLNQMSYEEFNSVISKTGLSLMDFGKLISTQAESYLEDMAIKAKELTWQYHGRIMQLYAPLYLSNYCVNHCLYCGFNHNNEISRKKLSLYEIEQQAEALAAMGHCDVLLLTGEDRKETPLSYLVDSVKIAKKYFSSVGIEIFPMQEDEYKQLIQAGVTGLTLYQECYNREKYKHLHPRGPKSDYYFRLQAPERAAKAGINSINLGTLLGLDDWRYDLYHGAMHLEYLQKKYPAVEYGYSFPRFRNHVGRGYQVKNISDQELVQAILAMRLSFPFVSLSLSTREPSYLRDKLIGLGVNRMSAGSRTSVGGYASEVSDDESDPQFSIADHRGIEEVVKTISKQGYQPVFKNWEALL